MLMTQLTDSILFSINKVFLHGMAGTGKTTLACQRLQYLIKEADHDDGILVLVPQRALAEPYKTTLSSLTSAAKQDIDILTMSGLVRRMVSLFWPLINNTTGFREPYKPAKFLTLETSQYFMGRLLDPFLAKGYFSTVRLTRNRLLGQLIDNLNKSAIVGFPYTEIGERLTSSWVGEDAQKRVYADSQELVSAFRAFCLQNNLVDFSLQVELFKEQIWPNPLAQNYLKRLYPHIIYDNVEEDPPYVHDIIEQWLPHTKSALIVQDDMAGYNSFLGADPVSAQRFESLIQNKIYLNESLNQNDLREQILTPLVDITQPVPFSLQEIKTFVGQPEQRIRFYPELLKMIAEEIHTKIESGIAPEEIVILSPFVSDSTVFTLAQALETYGIKLRSLRPSTALNDDPVIKTLLTFAVLNHPEWELATDPFVLGTVLNYAVEDLDLIRAYLISQKPNHKAFVVQLEDLSLASDVEARLSSKQLLAWKIVQNWLANNQSLYPLDVFFSRLFGELLSQPGFAFHNQLEAGQVTARLIESYKKFRASFSSIDDPLDAEIGKEFVKSVQSGLLAATYVEDYTQLPKDSVLITPITSFVALHKTVDYQFWLNVGSSGWYERLEQPLTHPIVLSRHWKRGQKWTADDDLRLSRETLIKMVNGLFNRCRNGIYLGIADYNEGGTEEKGLLMLHLQALYRRARRDEHDA